MYVNAISCVFFLYDTFLLKRIREFDLLRRFFILDFAPLIVEAFFFVGQYLHTKMLCVQ